MLTYRVSFDGEWQEDFDDVGSALDWAREVGETGRIVARPSDRLDPLRLVLGDVLGVRPGADEPGFPFLHQLAH